ncbi:MAG: hypothetical protein K8W52_09735 [Deltaproteobacteria bacterium]|nr:hypothetical protein [Deltaproteobacteria bacterium]
MFDFFDYATPPKSMNPVTTGAGIASDGGSVISALGRMGQVEGGGPIGNAIGAVSNTVTGISEMLHGDYAAGAGDIGSGIFKGLNAANGAGLLNMGAMAPGLGILAGGAQAVGHGVEAYNHRDQMDAGYLNNQFWTESGKATWGAASAIAAADPTGIASLYVGGSKLALDGLGALSGLAGEGINAVAGTHLDLGFNAGSAVGAAEHLIYDGGRAAVNGVTNMATDAYSWLDRGVRGIYGM